MLWGGGEDNKGNEKAEEQKREEYAKTIAQWVWKLRYLKDEETIVAELMKAEVPTYNLYKFASTVELIVIDGVVPLLFYFYFYSFACHKKKNTC